MRCMRTRMKCVQMCDKVRGVRVFCSQHVKVFVFDSCHQPSQTSKNHPPDQPWFGFLRRLRTESNCSNDKRSETALSSRLWDSATKWSAEAFNTIGVVVVRGKTSRVPSLLLLHCCARARARACKCCHAKSSAERCETSLSGFLLNAARPPSRPCGAPTSAECCETSPPQLLEGLRVPAAGCREHV